MTSGKNVRDSDKYALARVYHAGGLIVDAQKTYASERELLMAIIVLHESGLKKMDLFPVQRDPGAGNWNEGSSRLRTDLIDLVRSARKGSN